MINWQAVGTIATFCAVLVALTPIYIAWQARKAKARNLRIRIAVKLTKLKPTLNNIKKQKPCESVPGCFLLSDEHLRNTISELDIMIKETEVLEPEEQDALSVAVANLELMLPMLCSKTLSDDGANTVLLLIDKAISLLEKHGILAGKPFIPWENNRESE